jgi:hypothetical protein
MRLSTLIIYSCRGFHISTLAFEFKTNYSLYTHTCCVTSFSCNRNSLGFHFLEQLFLHGAQLFVFKQKVYYWNVFVMCPLKRHNNFASAQQMFNTGMTFTIRTGIFCLCRLIYKRIMKSTISRTIVLHFVLCGCNSQSVTLWQGHKLSVFQDRVLKEIERRRQISWRICKIL